MRIDDAILSGSVVGSSATISLSGSFTGSGHITLADTASLVVSASYALTASYAVTASLVVSASYAETSSYSITSSHALDIQNQIVDYATLGTEFTNVVTLGSGVLSVDFSAGAIFDKTVSLAEGPLVFSNMNPGDVKTIIATGGTSLSFPTTTVLVGNTAAVYDGTKDNVYSIIVKDNTKQYYTISQS